MRVLLNGEDHQLAAGTTLGALVESLGAPAGGRGVAVALDGEVVPRRAWEQTQLDDGARVEVVVAVQGG